MKLFICEKPSQAKDIAPHLGAVKRGDGCFTGQNVTVTWAIGHLLEQAKPEHYNAELKSWNLGLLPVIPEQWHMQIKPSTKAQYAIVSKLVKQATEVVIATDADREGEVIAREILQLNGYRGQTSRLWLSAFDDASVKKALGKLLPGTKTLPMYFSGMGRARADWLSGMNMTMALTSAFGAGGKGGVLHCGRVQTPVLALIVHREQAIQSFKPKTYYTLSTSFNLSDIDIPFTWLPKPELLDAEGHVVDQNVIQAIANNVSGQTGNVVSIDTSPEREVAPLPYNLGSLQREASARFGMKSQAVLDAVQALYEKHKASTYPRTDCEYLPTSMLQDVESALNNLAKITPELARFTKAALDINPSGFSGRAFNDKRITAHHAIIPTLNPNVNHSLMSSDERTIYDMICRRYIAQFLGDYEYMQTVIIVECRSENFRVTGKMPTKQGWKALYQQDSPRKPAKTEEGDDEESENITSLPSVTAKQQTRNMRCEVLSKKTKPPKRYTEGTLISAMESIDKEIDDPRLKAIMKNKEKAGIGTDATRSAIIEGLFTREYIVANKKDLHPTPKGIAIINLIEEIAPELADPVLTAQWEEQLSQIENGELKLEQFESGLAEWLKKLTAQIQSKAGTIQIKSQQDNSSCTKASEDLDVACPTCSKAMRRIKGSKGYFWGCSGYQDGCRTTMHDNDGKPVFPSAGSLNDDVTELKYPCPECQKPLKRRQGKNGFFWGCTGYPECKHTIPDDNGKPGQKMPDQIKQSSTHIQAKPAKPKAKAGDKCPVCGSGELIGRVFKETNKPYIGCNQFPKCRYFAWPEKI